jgi:hypothetical protein
MERRKTVRKRLSWATAMALCWAPPLPALAASGACDVKTAVSDIQFYDIGQEASTAPQGEQILKQISALGAKVKNPNEAVGPQLSAGDNEKFGELTAQLKHIQTYNYIQSNQSRDAQVAYDMLNVALKIYDDAAYVPPSDVTTSPGSVVIYLRVVQPNLVNYVPSTDTSCTIDFALSQEEGQVLQQISSETPILQRDKTLIDALRVKYGIPPGGPLDRSKMEPNDVQTLDLIQNEVRPGINDLRLALDLSNIRQWWDISQLIYMDDLQDVEKTTEVGDTFRAQEATLSPTSKAMANVWTAIDEKVPNDDYTEYQQMNAVLKKAGVIAP